MPARPGAGRPKGARNKVTKDIKALAQSHCPAAIEQLALIAKHSESHAARVAAIKELLDRGYGRSAQAVELTGKEGGPLEHKVVITFD